MAQIPSQHDYTAGMNQQAAKTAIPLPPRTEAPGALHAEMEQRKSEAMQQAEYHHGEAHRWGLVAEACGAALETLNQQQPAQAEGGEF